MLKYILAVVISMAAQSVAGNDELLVFTAPGCRPCAHMKSLLARHPELTQHFKVVYFDITTAEETAQLFQVQVVPTFVRLRGDHEIARLVGSTTERGFREWVDKHDEKPAK